jgi:hypothetical protein
MPVQCRTREKSDGDKYTVCYHGSGKGKGNGKGKAKAKPKPNGKAKKPSEGVPPPSKKAKAKKPSEGVPPPSKKQAVMSEATLLKRFGGHSVPYLNAHLDKMKGTDGKGGGSKGAKLLKIQRHGGLGSLAGKPPKGGQKSKPAKVSVAQVKSARAGLMKIVAPQEGVPPAPVIPEGVPPVKLYQGDPFPGFSRPAVGVPQTGGGVRMSNHPVYTGSEVGAPPPGERRASYTGRSSVDILKGYRASKMFGYPLKAHYN